MAHDEFPPLTDRSLRILQSANLANCRDIPGGVRPFAAAVIREAINQAAPFRIGFHLVVEVADLSRIADNLHALPPPPPTREQMEEALQHLIDMYGARVAGESTDELLQTLRAGIAHHCKVQP